MHKSIVLFCLFLTSLLPLKAQIFQYIDMEDGLSSRRVLSIRQDAQDFIWILTHKGIDRYDGQRIKFYPLIKDGNVTYCYPNQNTLKTDPTHTIWEIGEDGLAFRYDELKDSFQLAFDLKASFPETRNVPVSTTYLDQKGNIWFCSTQRQYIYQPSGNKSYPVKNPIPEKIVCITQAEEDSYFLASEHRLYFARLSDETLTDIREIQLQDMDILDYVYYHRPSGLLVVNSLLEKSLLLNPQNGKTTDLGNHLKDININNIIPDRTNPDRLLIATDGGGVLTLDIAEKRISRFLTDDSKSLNKMNGNIIKDVCMDKDNRIWCVVFPIGITLYSDRYPSYKWVRHETSNANSLSHNCINHILEDTDGDVWFATNNGISCYHPKEKRWTTYCTAEKQPQYDNHVFASLCETRSGNILAGGYMSGIYEINKKTGTVTHHQQKKMDNPEETPDKYIRCILRDSEETIWTGGFYSLKGYGVPGKEKQEYIIPYPITYISVRDTNRLWIGTTNGIYTLDKTTHKLAPFLTEKGIGSVNMMCLHEGNTYVGTYENGLFIIDNITEKVTHYHQENSGIKTNNIYSIVPDKNGNVLLGTENGISIFHPKDKEFTNWAKEQGLFAANFNPTAGIHTKDGKILLGSNDGFIILHDSLEVPTDFKNRMVLSNLAIMYRTVHPFEKGSPLTQTLDETQLIRLKYNQNTFSLNVSSINFDTQESISYCWKLEGFYNEWSAPSRSGLIRYTNLSPGNYTLKIRAISLDNHQVIEERELGIIVERPFWLTFWAFLIYSAILIGVAYALVKYMNIRRERKISEDKINFFTQAAHDIRTPLTLIKAPLSEILQKEKLSEEGMNNLRLAVQGTDNLSELADNLINFQKEELYTSEIIVTEVELNQYLDNYIHQFDSFARQKGISLSYSSTFSRQTVWIDIHKINSIIRNLLSNAFKYTPAGGSVTAQAECGKNIWTLTIRDTGIGISKKDQKKLFKYLFRGQNAANQSESGAGIGMLLTYKLIERHEGKISFESTENEGTCFRLTFPIKNKNFRHKETTQTEKPERQQQTAFEMPIRQQVPPQADMPRILVVEDNESLRRFIMQSLADTCQTLEAANGQEGVEKAEKEQPDLIISDIMMPVMDGREMCRTLKGNMDTSHIPIILLTALSGDEQILQGLETRADQYLVKPFDVKILKATIHTLLENRRLMRQRFQQAVTALPTDEAAVELPTNLDDEFMKRVTRQVKDNLGKELNVDILCTAMNMSRTSFYNKIKALTGIAPAEFIRNIRMQEAALLLKSHRFTVSEVSDRMGFADPKYFTDTFKKFYGVPPSIYMKNQKGQE